MRYTELDWYRAPELYDVVFDVSTAAETDFIAAVHERHGAEGAGAEGAGAEGIRTLEAACGTGRLLAALQGRGFDMAGFDASEAMLERARARCPGARLWRDTMQGFVTDDRFDLAFNLLSSFKYLTSDEDAVAHLRRMADVLVPGGIYLLGVHTSDYGSIKRSRERWAGEQDGVHVVCNLQSWPPDPTTRTERVRSRLVVTEGEGTTGYETHWTFRTYDEDELEAVLRAEPRLELAALYGFEHDIEQPRLDLRDGRLDHILVLRRVSPGRSGPRRAR